MLTTRDSKADAGNFQVVLVLLVSEEGRLHFKDALQFESADIENLLEGNAGEEDERERKERRIRIKEQKRESVSDMVSK